ncbi:hypothetical protein N7523_006430 [Penicillium sp. IBT 18751x]|nr:hypothetical protein N7523_006430 [Penicillium sp. IBT 18751x]
MAQDPPADTAGPSSPPPQLPEGWLPQWEGVQRKWYYVQRTTGKSQWDIPTEPVVLTPSTTPTSIGTGPSQAPSSRPPTMGPQVGQENTMVGRMGSLADDARISSSLDAQLNAQSQNPPHASSETGWFSNQPGQHYLHHLNQRFIPGDGGYHSQRSYSQNMGMGPTGAHSFHPQHVMGQQAFGQPYPGTHWVGHGDGSQGRSEFFNQSHPDSSYQGHGLKEQVQFPQQVGAHGNPAGHLHNLRPEHRPHEPQWQTTQQPALSNPPSQWMGSSNLPQFYPGSQYTSQAIGNSSSNMAPQSSHFSDPSLSNSESSGSRTGQEPMHKSFNTNPGGQLQSPMGYSPDESHAQQDASLYRKGFSDLASGARSAQAYQSQPSSAHGHYHSTSMARTQSGPGFAALGFPAAPDTHGNAHQYQNPLVQVGAQQYLPQQQADHPRTTHQYHPGSSTGQQGQQSGASTSSRIARSDPVFVSGPWASSTPPTSRAGRPPQQS